MPLTVHLKCVQKGNRKYKCLDTDKGKVRWIGLSPRIEVDYAHMFFSVKLEPKTFEYHGADFGMGINGVFDSGR